MQPTSGAAALKSIFVPDPPQYSKEYEESKIQYVFFYGAKPLPLHQIICKTPFLYPGVLQPIKNHKYRDRKQVGTKEGNMIEGEPVQPTHPGEDTSEEVWRTQRAGVQVSDIIRIFGNTRGDGTGVGTGVIALPCLVDVDPLVIEEIAESLLSQIVDEENRILPAFEFKQVIRAQIGKCSPENRLLQRKVADLLIRAIDQGADYMRGHMDQVKAEMRDRALPDGRGRGKIGSLEREYIRLIGKEESDYETDTRAVTQSTVQQMAALIQPMLQAQTQFQPATSAPRLMTKEEMEQQAMVFALTLKQLGFVPQQPAAVPPAQPTTPPATPPANPQQPPKK